MWSLTSLAISTKRKLRPSVRRTCQDRYDGSIGRQCPPTPGPGVNFMKPNGLLAAASITDQTSMSSSWQYIASSLTSAMLTCRKVFSSSLASSASRVPLTGTTLSTSWPKNSATALSDASSTPETIFGVFFRPYTGSPGLIRSGEKPTWKSAPARSPLIASRRGTTTSSVVPGYVVDSRITQQPLRTYGAMLSDAFSMYDRSGAPSRSGVGTEITATSKSAMSAGSADGVNRPVAIAAAISASVMSSM